MSAILRFQPGDTAPWSGNYELVGHYGERMKRTVWRDTGSPLPPTATHADGPVWWVFRDATAAESKAA